MSYTMNYADERAPLEDEVVENGSQRRRRSMRPGYVHTRTHSRGEPSPLAFAGVHILIDPKASLHVVGTTMDYVEDDLAAEFVFHNPNAKGTCGCGESFNV